MAMRALMLRRRALGRPRAAARAVHRSIARLMAGMGLRRLPRLWRWSFLRRRPLLWCGPLLRLGLPLLPLLRRGLIAPGLIAPRLIAGRLTRALMMRLGRMMSPFM
jgi:hypothetical protein